MSIFDRAARQREADRAGVDERTAALLRDLAADLDYYGPPEVVPNLPPVKIPAELRGEPIEIAAELAPTLEAAISDCVRRLHAEAARLIRLAPALPGEYRWAPELSAPEYDFMRNAASATLRLVVVDAAGRKVDPAQGLAAIWGV